MIEGQLEIQMTASALDEEDTSQKQTLDPLNHGSRDEQKSKKRRQGVKRAAKIQTDRSPRQKMVAATKAERKPFLMVLQSHKNNKTIG